MSTRHRRAGLPVKRDTLLFVLGSMGIGYQQVTERYNVALLVLYGLMVGVPGLAQLIIALRGLGTDREDDADTPSSSASSPLPSSPTQ